MRKGVACLAVLLLASAATPVLAAVQYEFQQTTRVEGQNRAGGTFVGRAVLDGGMSRVEVISGSAYEKGSYFLTGDSRRIFVVQPASKSYVEIPATNSQNPLNNPNISVSNVKVEVRKLDDRPVIAGLPTEHFRLEATYDITVSLGMLPLRQQVKTVIDKWTTTAFDDIAGTEAKRDLLTGRPEIDELIEAEVGKMRGLPLKQITTVTTRSDDSRRRGGVLGTQVRKHSTEMVVTKIERTEVHPSIFIVPVGFTRTTNSQKDDTARVNILDLEPAP